MMSENENNLSKALAENGSFDSGRAKEVKEKVTAALVARMRFVERMYWIYFILFVCIALAAFKVYELAGRHLKMFTDRIESKNQEDPKPLNITINAVDCSVER